MKLHELQTADSYNGTWLWQGHDEASVYISVRAYPAVEGALEAYAQFIGEPWPEEFDTPDIRIVPCCDHDQLDCFRNEAEECVWAIARKVWAFEV